MKRARPPSSILPRPVAVVVLAAAALLAPAPASAWDFTIRSWDFNLSVTETFRYTYHLENEVNETGKEDDDKYHHFMNVLDVSLSHGDFRAGTRLDLNLYANTPFDQSDPSTGQPFCPGSSSDAWFCSYRDRRYVNHFSMERLYLLWARPELDLTLGDFYASFGKGLALNVVKIDELGQDTAIRGGKLIVHHGGLGLTLLGGQFNPLDVDDATGYLAPWQSEPILAGRLEYRFFDKVIVGGQGVFIVTDYGGETQNKVLYNESKTDRRVIFGGSVEVPNLLDGMLSFTGEVDAILTTEKGVDHWGGPDALVPVNGAGGSSGIGAYGSTTFHLKSLTLLGEFKYYDDFESRAPTANKEPYKLLYHQPPTLERIRGEVYNPFRVAGPRLRADYNLGELGPVELLLFANYAFFKNWGNDNSDWHSVHDPYGGLELTWKGRGEGKLLGEGRLDVTSGIRMELDDTKEVGFRNDVHLEAHVEQSVVPNHSLTLGLYFLRRAKTQLSLNHPGYETVEWPEVELSIGYKWSPRLAATLAYEHTEDPDFISENPNLPSERQDFFAGILQYFFTPGTYASVRVGQNRPGIKCFNGACRYYPSFSGVQVLFVGRL
jgi:hypothetical protein